MINFKVRTKPANLAAAISALPRAVRGVATEAAAVYLIGNDSHGLRHYPPSKYVTRARAYGKTFFTDKQRRYFFSALKSGILKVPYLRTRKTANGWYTVGKGAKISIRNDSDGAKFTAGDKTQSRHEALVGWRTISKVAADNERGMIRAAEQAAQREIDRRGLGK